MLRIIIIFIIIPIRAVTDILEMLTTHLSAPNKYLNNILTVFNSLHTRLQFTMEISNVNSISFLDITLIVDNKNIFNQYHKPTFLAGKF